MKTLKRMRRKVNHENKNLGLHFFRNQEKLAKCVKKSSAFVIIFCLRIFNTFHITYCERWLLFLFFLFLLKSFHFNLLWCHTSMINELLLFIQSLSKPASISTLKIQLLLSMILAMIMTYLNLVFNKSSCISKEADEIEKLQCAFWITSEIYINSSVSSLNYVYQWFIVMKILPFSFGIKILMFPIWSSWLKKENVKN